MPSEQPLDPPELADPRRLTIEATAAAAELVGSAEVAAAWDQPSALDGMTVGALSAHLVRAAGAVIAYLDRTDPTDRPADPADVLTPITYFHAAIDSPIHEQIKDVSASEAVIGPAEMAAKAAALVETMNVRFATEPADRLVGALGKRMLSLDDFCRTRLIEVLMHLDDLATSVGVATPETDPAGRTIVMEILVGIARHLHGDWAVLHAMARRERLDDDVFPVF